MQSDRAADLIIYNGKVATEDSAESYADAVAIKDNRFVAVGTDSEVLGYKGSETKLIDVKRRTVVPGLADTHTHFIRYKLQPVDRNLLAG